MSVTLTPNRRGVHRIRTAHSASPSMSRSRRQYADEPPSPARSVATAQPRYLAPRTVTPTSALAASTWEDFDEGVFGTRRKNRNKPNPASFNASSACSERSYTVVEEDEEMPMDEMMATLKTTNTPPPATSTNATRANSHSQPPRQQVRRLSNKSTTSNGTASDDGLLPPHHQETTGVSRIIATLKQSSSSSRPSNLTPEERVLWDSIQNAIVGAVRSEHGSQQQTLERKFSARETDLEIQVSGLRAKLAEQARLFGERGSGVAKFRDRVQQLEEQLRQSDAALKGHQAEHESEVRAIQRVLADVSTEREQETQELDEKVGALVKKVETLEAENKAQPQAGPSSNSGDESSKPPQGGTDDEISQLKKSLQDSNDQKTAAKRETDKKSRRLIVMERDHKVAKAQLHKAEDEKKRLAKEVEPLKKQLDALKEEVTDLLMRNLKLDEELELNEKQLQKLKRNARSNDSTPPRHEGPPYNESVSSSESVSSVEVDNLQRNLTETASSLENAKKIIASLENANGSLALDLRAKLKAKEEDLHVVQNESAERKRRLDSLATELRDLQRKQGDAEHVEAHTKGQVVRQKALMLQLEKGVSGLRSASVVHEVSTATGQPDSANVDQISEILGDALVALRTTLEMTEQYVDEHDEKSVAFSDAECTSEVGRHIDDLIRHDREAAAIDLRHELDQKKNAVRRLEDALKKQNEEMKRLRAELNGRTRGKDESNEKLRAQIQILREQCSTNMEVLAKKERELFVLRSSLKVDEGDAGYISDDASDADEDEVDTAMSPGKLNGYGPAETEALGTILAHTDSRAIALSGRSPEVETLRNELMKALSDKGKAVMDIQTERESLGNAKMIISSLEKANKSMMEDLRSRLQDSNTAIASLLDKSMEHEKTSYSLREEVEKVKKEKDEIERKHQTQVKKMKDESKVYSLRIAAKDREMNEIRKGKGQEGKSPSEEKKEDPDESTEEGSS